MFTFRSAIHHFRGITVVYLFIHGVCRGSILSVIAALINEFYLRGVMGELNLELRHFYDLSALARFPVCRSMLDKHKRCGILIFLHKRRRVLKQKFTNVLLTVHINLYCL